MLCQIACKIADQLDVINSSPSIENGLTEFVTEEIKISSSIPRIPVSRDVSPFENQTPSEILSRERMVYQKSYTATETTVLTVIDPALWAADLTNEGCLRTFRYLRWKSIKYRIVVQSNPFLFGYFFATCIPYRDNRRAPMTSSITDNGYMSHSDCLIVDITSMPESTLTVPWLFNNTWIDLEKWVAGTEITDTVLDLSGLKLIYDNTISATSSTVPKTFSISVFITVEGPEVAGPVTPGSSMRRHEAQMFAQFAAGAASHLAGEAIEAGIQYMMGAGETDTPVVSEPVVAEVPEDVAPPAEVIPQVYGGMNYSASRHVLGSGTMKLACKQNSIIDFLQMPSCVARDVLISGSGTTVSFGNQTIWDGIETNHSTLLTSCSRLRFLAQFFRFWRGSVTYTIMFVSSPMVTFRLKVQLSYQSGNLTSAPPGDTLQSIVTVRGTTLHQVTVPYLYTTPWRPIRPGGSGTYPLPEFYDLSPKIYVSEFSPASKSGDITPQVYMILYESANRDFVFNSQIEPSPQEPDPGKVRLVRKHEAQMNIAKFRAQDITQFGHTNRTHFASDVVTTFEGMAKRWSPRQDSSVTRGFYRGSDYQSDRGVSRQSTLECLKSIFFWQRGQYRIKVSFNVDETLDPSTVAFIKMASDNVVALSSTAGVPAAIRFTDGATAISLGLTQVIEATIPFLCSTEWIECCESSVSYTGAARYYYDPEIWVEGTSPVLLINFVAVCAGPDFCFSYSLPPPWGAARWYDCVPHAAPAPASVTTSPQAFSSRTTRVPSFRG